MVLVTFLKFARAKGLDEKVNRPTLKHIEQSKHFMPQTRLTWNSRSACISVARNREYAFTDRECRVKEPTKMDAWTENLTGWIGLAVLASLVTMHYWREHRRKEVLRQLDYRHHWDQMRQRH
jgi:hypothetical protein